MVPAGQSRTSGDARATSEGCRRRTGSARSARHAFQARYPRVAAAVVGESPGSIGPAVSDTEEKVVDVDDENIEMPSGEVGELLIRGPQIMQGYYNNPTATAETITSDGWLKTGDIVKMDKDGYVWILDRKKELIKYKGFQVPPAELEGILLEHDAVSDVAVIGKLDMEAGEIPKAFVVTKQGHEVSEDVLMEFVAQKVATFKRIREIEFIDTIPKNPSGKLLRRVLKDQERSNS